MNNFVGSVGEFAINGRETFESYQERVELLFAANRIKDEDQKKALFLTVCGATLYGLIRNLVAPSKPVEKSLKEITDLVSGHPNQRILRAVSFSK